MEETRRILERLGLPREDSSAAPTSEKRFPDGAQYRIDMRYVHFFISICFLCFLAFPLGTIAETVPPDVETDYQGMENPAQSISELCAQLLPSVVGVEADDRNGSGFLVSREGLIATNHHVVANARFLAVQFHDGRRVLAKVVAVDAFRDVAVLKVHAKHTRERLPLVLATPEERQRILVGDSVLAIGSPLGLQSVVTQGIVSRVGTLEILGDFLIEPGSSGGPLVDSQGRVLGINTFGFEGVSGTIRVHILEEILRGIDTERINTLMMPVEELPNNPESTYPVPLLKVKASGSGGSGAYGYSAKGSQVLITTPVAAAAHGIRKQMLQAANRYKRRGRKIADPAYSAIEEVFYTWLRTHPRFAQNILEVRVTPEYSQTTGSMFAQAIVGSLSGAHLPSTFKFNFEFYGLHVYRDGELIPPIRQARSLVEAFEQSMATRFVDEAYAGWNTYDPAEFMFGETFRFDVYDARNHLSPHHTKTFKSSSELISNVRRDFREALGSARSYWADQYPVEETPPGTGNVTVTDDFGLTVRQHESGVEIVQALPGSPAYAGGFRTGDYVTRIEGSSVKLWLRQKMGERADFPKLLSHLATGRIGNVKITVLHRGDLHEILLQNP